MKNLKKAFKKIPKKAISLFLVLVMVLNYFLPIANVFADGEYVIAFTTNGDHTLEAVDGHLKIDGQYVDLRDSNDNTIGTVECTSSKACAITVSDGTGGTLNYNSANKFELYMQGHEVDPTFSFSANEDILVQDYVTNQGGNQGGQQEPENESNFDVKAYVVWSCTTGVCYHYFDNIPGFDDGNSVFYKDSTITADNNSNITFDVNAEYKGWAIKEDFERWVNDYKAKNEIDTINWAQVNPEDIFLEPRNMSEWENQAIAAHACTKPAQDAHWTEEKAFEVCVDEYAFTQSGILPLVILQPLGEPEYNNSYVSYGDRNFKSVIYNDNYKGVTIGDLSSLNYYPSTWTNPYLRRDQFDISGTTKNNPTGIATILLEKVVKIKEINVNNFTISNIEALDVPANAVSISKENGEWRLEFSSNFYDNVVFKVTDSNGGESYIQIKRYTVDAWIRFDNNRPVLTADFYFDRTKSYTDFDLTAKIVYKDGTTKNVSLTAKYGIDDGLGNITRAYEVDEENPQYGDKGKGLKKSTFEFALQNGEDRNISRVYLNAEYKGSTASNYAGAYVGSGEGTLANIYQGEEE